MKIFLKTETEKNPEKNESSVQPDWLFKLFLALAAASNESKQMEILCAAPQLK